MLRSRGRGLPSEGHPSPWSKLSSANSDKSPILTPELLSGFLFAQLTSSTHAPALVTASTIRLAPEGLGTSEP